MIHTSPQISIQPENLPEGLVRLHIIGHDLPENFLGISFHLRLEGVPVELVSSQPGKEFPDVLFLVQQRNTEVIAGLSFKAGDAGTKPNAELMAIEMKTDGSGLLAVTFDQMVLSTVDETSEAPVRRDLQDVYWNGVTFGVAHPEVSNELSPKPLSSQGGEELLHMPNTTQVYSEWNSSEIKSDLFQQGVQPLTDLYSFLFVTLVVLILLFLFVTLFKKMRA